MSKLLDLGIVSEETKGGRVGGNQDANKTSCGSQFPGKFYKQFDDTDTAAVDLSNVCNDTV